MNAHPHTAVTDPSALIPAYAGPLTFNADDWSGDVITVDWQRTDDGRAIFTVYDEAYELVPVLEADAELVALVGHGLELRTLRPVAGGKVGSAMFEANRDGSGTWLAYTSDVLDGGPTRSGEHPVVAAARLLRFLG